MALGKAGRTCTAHLVGNFVSYDHLSPPYKAFVSMLDNVHVPNSMEEEPKRSSVEMGHHRSFSREKSGWVQMGAHSQTQCKWER